MTKTLALLSHGLFTIYTIGLYYFLSSQNAQHKDTKPRNDEGPPCTPFCQICLAKCSSRRRTRTLFCWLTIISELENKKS